MFVNKWLVTDSLNNTIHHEWQGGICLELCYKPGEMSDLYKNLQKLPVENPFAIFLSEKQSLADEVSDSYIENIISLFFQPSYFLANDKPVIFVSDKTGNPGAFIEKLSEKCRKQGLSLVLLKIQNENSPDNSDGQFAYEVTSPDLDYNAIVENWLSHFLEDKNPGEVHLLFWKKDTALSRLLNKVQEKETQLYSTEHYKFASLFYQKQRQIDRYKKELDLKNSVEKSTQLYLDMQKKQTADNVEWYHHEYEVLPAWYKRLGHIIKVLTGKRTFRSLFDDKVKKYKD
jgi:hypothetical protein